MNQIARATTSISAMTLLSRILGVARDSLMMATFGANWISGTFMLAWMVPNLFRRLFGEGALSAAFVPAYTRARATEGPEAARSLLARTTGPLVLLLSLLALGAVILCRTLPAGWFGLEIESGRPDPRADQLLLDLLSWLAPYLVPVCIMALFAGALNSLGSFALPAAAPILLNLVWIGALLLSRRNDPAAAEFLAIALLLGGIAQLALVSWGLLRRRALPAPSFRMPPPGDPARRVFLAMGPALLGMSLVQLNTLVDQVMAVYLIGTGTNNYVYLANRLLLFPHSLTAIALAVAAFPSLSALGAGEDRGALRARLEKSTAAALFFAVPASLGLMLVAPDLVEVLFHHGEFTDADVSPTVWASIALVAGLPALGAAQLYARGFYALQDTRTPARIAGWLVLVNLALNLLFVLGLGLGVAGLTLGTTGTVLGNAWLLRKRFCMLCPQSGWTGGPAVLRRTAVAAAVMGVVVWGLRQILPGDDHWQQALRLGVAVLAGIGVYLAVHRAMGTELVRHFRGKG